jgi:hypothetical protein
VRHVQFVEDALAARGEVLFEDSAQRLETVLVEELISDDDVAVGVPALQLFRR